MGTPATIGLMRPNGTIESIYLHQDGYYEEAGYKLLSYYSDVKLVEELLSLGPLSDLGSTIGTKHDPWLQYWQKLDKENSNLNYFDTLDKWEKTPESKMCHSFFRDMESHPHDISRFVSAERFRENVAEYGYLYLENENKWYTTVGFDRRLEPLQEVMDSLPRQEDMD